MYIGYVDHYTVEMNELNTCYMNSIRIVFSACALICFRYNFAGAAEISKPYMRMIPDQFSSNLTM